MPDACKIKLIKKFLQKIKFFRLKIMRLWASYKKKMKEIFFFFFTSLKLKSMKKRVGSGVGSGAG